MFDLTKITRENIKALKPYSSARDEYEGEAGVFLDANENPFDNGFNRYPDPMQRELKEKLSEQKGVKPERIFIGNGSDEAIDLLFRCFCEPGKSNVIVCPPTYGMYEVSAAINDVEVKSVALLPEVFQLDVERIKKAINENTRMIFICSPNNPTGNLISEKAIISLLDAFNGIVVVDEAYVDFSNTESFVSRLVQFGNLVVLQTFSKALGLAGLRVGLAFASPEIISLFNKVKAPYNVNVFSQQEALKVLERKDKSKELIAEIITEREKLKERLNELNFVEKVYESEANFLLLKAQNANEVYQFLIAKKIVVRNRSRIMLCENCLRITIGKPEENIELLTVLKTYENEKSIVY